MSLHLTDVYLRNKHPQDPRSFFFQDLDITRMIIRSLTPPQVTILGDTAERLSESHPDATDDLQRQQVELNEAWNSLQEHTKDRRESLNEAQKFYLFLSNARYISKDPRPQVELLGTVWI